MLLVNSLAALRDMHEAAAAVKLSSKEEQELAWMDIVTKTAAVRTSKIPSCRLHYRLAYVYVRSYWGWDWTEIRSDLDTFYYSSLQGMDHNKNHLTTYIEVT